MPLKVLLMIKNNPVEDLAEIRKMMEGSSKFLSLSGLSGVFAGLTALGGAAVAYLLLEDHALKSRHYYFIGEQTSQEKFRELEFKLVLLALIVFLLAFSFGFLFTYLKAKKDKKKLLNAVSYRLLRSLMIPLGLGGLFTIGLYYHGAYAFVPPATLIFYGMALLNASKYVQVELKYLALSEMILGVIGMYALGFGLLIWAIGFGLFHIIYGIIMWYKYDRTV